MLKKLMLAAVLLMLTACSSQPVPPKAEASLTDTYWKLLEIDGKAALLGAGDQELNMILTSEGGQIRGYSGCNRFSGRYELEGRQIKTRSLASTRRMCMSEMAQEDKMLKMLSSIVTYEIDGENLMLQAENGTTVMRFVAVYLH